MIWTLVWSPSSLTLASDEYSNSQRSIVTPGRFHSWRHLAESRTQSILTISKIEYSNCWTVCVRTGMSLDWDNLETPAEAFDRLRPSPEEDLENPLATEVSTDE